MKKKILLAVLSVLALCACDGSGTSSSSANGTSDVTSSEESSSVGETSSSTSSANSSEEESSSSSSEEESSSSNVTSSNSTSSSENSSVEDSSSSIVVQYNVTTDTTGVASEAEISIWVDNSSYDVGATVQGTVYFGNPFYSVTKIEAKGHSDLTVTVEEPVYGTSFSFVMPAYDVCLVPTVVKAQTQSLTLTTPLDENIERFSIQGDQTGYSYRIHYEKEPSSYFPNVTTADFVPGDVLSADIEVKDTVTQLPAIKFDGTSDTSAHLPDSKTAYTGTNYYAFHNIALPTDATSISITYEDKPTWNIGVTNNDSIALVYKVNGSAVDNLNNVSLFDKVEISIGDDVKGVYNIAIKNKDVSKVFTQGSNKATWNVGEEFVVEVTKDSTKHAIYVDNKVGDAIDVSLDSNSSTKIIDDGAQLNTNWCVQNNGSTPIKVKVVVKVGKKEKISATSETLEQWGPFYFVDGHEVTATDDVYIEVTKVVE